MLIGVTSSGLVLLAVLACPVGMGLMMVLMGRGMMGGMKHDERERREAPDTSLAEMKAEQARLAEKIERLENDKAKPQGDESASDREPDPVA